MTTDGADYSRWGRYASAEVEAAETPVRSPWGADASAGLDVDDAGSDGREGLWGEGDSADEFEYADDVEGVDGVEDADDVEGVEGVEDATVAEAAEPADGPAETAVPVELAEPLEFAVPAYEVQGFASTGHEAVDAALRAVENASRLPVGEQLAAYEAAHTTLREVLGSIEE